MFASSKYLSPYPRAIVGGDFLSLERTKKYLGEARCQVNIGIPKYRHPG